LRPRLHFEPLKLLNFDFNADPDPALHSNADIGFQKYADPDPHPCLKHQSLSEKKKQNTKGWVRHCLLANVDRSPASYSTLYGLECVLYFVFLPLFFALAYLFLQLNCTHCALNIYINVYLRRYTVLTSIFFFLLRHWKDTSMVPVLTYGYYVGRRLKRGCAVERNEVAFRVPTSEAARQKFFLAALSSNFILFQLRSKKVFKILCDACVGCVLCLYW
jgi:hypothetical protein